MKSVTPFGAALCGLVLAAGIVATAREPGIAPVTPPGLTLGIPIAASLSEGVYLVERNSIYDTELNNNYGLFNGQKTSFFVSSLQVTYVPGITLLGATYKAFVIVPAISANMDRTTLATGRPLGHFSRTDLANPKFQPLDLTWDLGYGFNVGAAIGFYAPLGQYKIGAPINIGTSFWTVEPSLGFTYLKDGWNASLQAMYDTNTMNPLNHYRSGDQLLLNATLTKNWAGWKIGPVAYYEQQVSADTNDGGHASFGGNIFPAPINVGVGPLVSHALGPVTVTAFVTRDVVWRNTVGGTKAWLNFTIKAF